MRGGILSVNVGQPRIIEWEGRKVRTAFVKEPVEGRRRVFSDRIEGDAQADRRVHGGPTMAAYAYPSEHYDDWRRTLGSQVLPWGSFGENLTLEGILEEEVRLGDVFEAGDASFQVTKPRAPCFKMNARFQRADAMALFAEASRPGFYLSVARTGSVAAGDPFVRVASDESRPTVVQDFQRRLARSRS